MRHVISDRTSPQGARRLRVGLGVAAAAFLLSVTPSLAFDPKVEALVKHFVECKILLLTNLQEQVRVCGGGNGPIPPATNSSITPVSGSPFAPFVAPVVTPPQIIKPQPQQVRN